MVTFKCGMPDKSKYKRFRIKTVDQIDDYAMMHELLRRYKGQSKREICRISLW
ncbi:MAG: hypothetical protein HS127_14365 [Planctomycetia bacterium]|nr:hypothetical protein [Planctomycetia bacterium]